MSVPALGGSGHGDAGHASTRHGGAGHGDAGHASTRHGGAGHGDHLEFIRRAGQTTRRAIAEHTGLSRSVVAQAVAELIAQGLVVERRLVDGAQARVGAAGAAAGAAARVAGGHAAQASASATRREAAPGPAAAAGAAAGGALRARRGRPTSVLELARQRGVVVACDIGHRHVTVATSDLQGRILAEQRVVFPVDEGAAATFRQVHAQVAAALTEARASGTDVLAFGVAFPFPVVRATGAVRAPLALAGWQGVNAADARPVGLGGPIIHDNDANFGAWGERMHGATPELDNLLYVKLSDGIGAGLIVDGVLLSGARGIGGEMGHIQVDPDGALCRCGRRGCLETVVAQSLPDLHRAGMRVGRAIAQLCAFIDPEVVVLGGQLGASSAPLVEGVREAFAEWMPGGTASGVEVRPASLGTRSELLGIVDRTLTAAWASGAVGRPSRATRDGAAAADPFSSCRRTNSGAVLKVPFDAERLVTKE